MFYSEHFIAIDKVSQREIKSKIHQEIVRAFLLNSTSKQQILACTRVPQVRWTV